jgi:hypothetical protein
MLWAVVHLELYCLRWDLALPTAPSLKVVEVGHSLVCPATLFNRNFNTMFQWEAFSSLVLHKVARHTKKVLLIINTYFTTKT